MDGSKIKSQKWKIKSYEAENLKGALGKTGAWQRPMPSPRFGSIGGEKQGHLEAVL
jgi:hypothetical protein